MKYENLKNARKINSYTIKYMAKVLAISPSYYSQIENGKRKLDYCTAVKIASVFNLQPDDIFYRYYKNKIIKTKKPITATSIFSEDSLKEVI